MAIGGGISGTCSSRGNKDGTESRWLRGEDVFAGLPVDPTRDQKVEDLLDRLIGDAST